MSDDDLMKLMLAVDPETKRIPPGVRAIANAVEAAERERLRHALILRSQGTYGVLLQEHAEAAAWIGECAQWQTNDSDECGQVDRELLALLRVM